MARCRGPTMPVAGWALSALLMMAVFIVAEAREEELYLGDFTLDPGSDNRKTPIGALLKASPSYPACITLCSSQKRAMRRQELSTRKQVGGARIVRRHSDSIAGLQAQEKNIQKRLLVLRASKRAHAAKERHAARNLLSVQNTSEDDERAERLAKFATSDSDKKEAAKIKRLLQERKQLLGYITPSKLLSNKHDAGFQKRLNSLPFSVAGETDCVGSCKKARTPKAQSLKKSAKTHMLPVSSDPPFVYQGGHDDCDAGGMMIMPPDFPVRVVSKGDCATCSAVCSTMKFSSPWMRDGRGSCGVRAESDTLDRYMRNFNGEVTMNLCTPLKGYGDFLTGEPTVNGFNGDVGYIGAPAHTMYEDYMSKNLGCCGQNQDWYSNSCKTMTACECDCCIYVYCNNNEYTYRYR